MNPRRYFAALFLPGWRKTATWLLTGWLFLPAGLVRSSATEQNPEATRPVRVAVMDFTTDDNLLNSVGGAAQCTVLAQEAAASSEPDVIWVERAQIQLAADELRYSAGGLTSTEGSLQVGRWLKADWAVLGRFTRNARNEDGHTLRLEVVDLTHADTLAARTLPVPGDRRETIAPEAALNAAVAATLHEALAEARAASTRHRSRRAIAPLFFRNVDSSPRLDGFGGELTETLTRAASRSTDLRVLQFPQANEARDEADLAVRGLTGRGENAWQRMADLYVWGTYRELPAANVGVAHIPVEFELTLWDGVNPPRMFKERTAVADLPGLADRLTDRCLAAARRVPAARQDLPSSGQERAVVSRRLREQGERLEQTAASHGAQREAFLHTAQGCVLASQARTALAAACFFAPLDRDAELARLRSQWPEFPMLPANLPLLDAWRRCNELARFIKRFPAAESGPLGRVALTRAQADADATLLQTLWHGEEQVHLPGSEPNLPVDVPDATIADWHVRLDRRFAQDITAYSQSGNLLSSGDRNAVYVHGGWLRTAFELVRDPAEAVRVVEAVWPLYKPLLQQDPRLAEGLFDPTGGTLAIRLRDLYARARQPDRSRALLAGLENSADPTRSSSAVAARSAAAPAAQAAALPVLFPTVRAFGLPSTSPLPTSELMPVPGCTIHNLALDDAGVLWISVLEQTTPPQMLSPATGRGNLWRFDPVSDLLQALPVSGLTSRSPATAILPWSGRVWLGLDFAGVTLYEPEQRQVQRTYSVVDGLATDNVDVAAASADGRLYFAGHGKGQPLLNQFNPAKEEWLRIELPQVPSEADPETLQRGGMPPMAPCTQAAAFGRFLLVGLRTSWLLLDTETRQVRDLRQVIPGVLGPGLSAATKSMGPDGFMPALLLSRTPRLCLADARGFWLVVDGSIVQFDPAHPDTARSWPLPSELRYGVTALASDDQDLWMVGPSVLPHPVGPTTLPPRFGFSPQIDGRGFVAALHAADGSWRGGFELSARAASLAASDQAVYIGLIDAAQPLLEIDKASTLQPPPRVADRQRDGTIPPR